MSEVVFSEENRRILVVVGNDVVALFPSMKENSTGEAVATQGLKGDMKHIAFDYRDCSRRNCVYETWCGTCEEREREKEKGREIQRRNFQDRGVK